jgi:hypothetical protein
MNRAHVFIVSLLTGIALELGIQLLSGRQEAWDSVLYWRFGLPVAVAISAAMGALSREGAWRWTSVIVPAQVLTMLVQRGEPGGLWPLALAFSLILSAPFVVVAFVVSKLRPAHLHQ